MSIEAQGADGGVISIRNGVPPSDPPGGNPTRQDPLQTPHRAPDEGGPEPQTTNGGTLENEPPREPPRREAQGREAQHGNHRSHHRHK